MVRTGGIAVVISALLAIAAALLLGGCTPPASTLTFYTPAENTQAHSAVTAVALYLINGDGHDRSIEFRPIGDAGTGEILSTVAAQRNSFAVLPSYTLKEIYADPDTYPQGEGIHLIANIFQEIVYLITSAEYPISITSPGQTGSSGGALADSVRLSTANLPGAAAVYAPQASYLAPLANALFPGAPGPGGPRAISEPFSAIAQSLQRAQYGVYLVTSPHPLAELVDYPRTSPPLHLLPLTPGVSAAITRQFPELAPTTLPLAGYPEVIDSTDIPGLYYGNILITSAATSPEILSLLCNAIITRLDIYRSLYPFLDTLTPEDIFKTFPAEADPAQTGCTGVL